MKISKLRNIIKEEYRKVIFESFADPLLQKLSKLGGMENNKHYGNFWNAAAKTYNIAWDKLPAGSVRKVSPSDKAVKKGMAFYVLNQQIENPYYNPHRWSASQVLHGPAVLAVTIDNKIQYFQQPRIGTSNNRGISGVRNARSTSGPVGKGAVGTMQVSKLKTLADEVYVFDLESYRGGTSALKSARADLKLGKDKFTDAKSWKRANLARYKDILQVRVSSRDAVDTMVASIVQQANAAVVEAMALPKADQYNDLLATIDGKEIPLKNVTNAMSRALQYYAEYISNENDAEREKTQGSGRDGFVASTDRYYMQRKNEKAGEIKKLLNKFKSGKLDGWY